MAEKIDNSQVRHVARLSRLELTDAEVERFASQLSRVLEYIEKLNELDTSSTEPMAHCLPIHNVFRPDEIRPSIGTNSALAGAPAKFEGYFKVPKILDANST